MRKSQSGMTLIELMVVVVIVGILAAIAYPSYRQQVIRSKRADAKVALQQSAQQLENCFTRFHKYGDGNCTIATTLQAAGIMSPDGNYNVKIAAPATDLTDLTFTLTATPQGGQTADTKCGNFTLSSSNVRGVSAGATAVAECWR